MDESVFAKIKSLLDERGVAYRIVHHAETRTSEESAKARGEDISVGGKALLMKVDESFKLFVISAARKVNSSKIKTHFGAKKLRFADAAELQRLTGLVPGSVPPFGNPILPFDLFVDTSVQQQPKIAFNAGSLTDSIIMPTHAYTALANATVFDFSE